MRDAGKPKELYTSNILIVSKPITKVDIRFQSRDHHAEYQPPTTYYITRSNASTRKYAQECLATPVDTRICLQLMRALLGAAYYFYAIYIGTFVSFKSVLSKSLSSAPDIPPINGWSPRILCYGSAI